MEQLLFTLSTTVKTSPFLAIPFIYSSFDKQHFKPVDFAGRGEKWAEEEFEKNIQRDVYKNQLCRDKGIRLLYYIPKSNTVPSYKSSSKFCGLYTNENVYNNLNQLKKVVSFDDI